MLDISNSSHAQAADYFNEAEAEKIKRFKVV